MADTAITINPARVSILSNQERLNGYTDKFKVLSGDIAYGSGATDTVTMTIGALPTNYLVDKAAVNVKTAFAGTTAMTIIVGTTTTTNNFIASTSILTAGLIQPSTGANTVATIAGSTGTASKSLVATFTNATSGSPSALTAGELEILLSIKNLDQV
jgi:hypothetical protein